MVSSFGRSGKNDFGAKNVSYSSAKTSFLISLHDHMGIKMFEIGVKPGPALAKISLVNAICYH
jgi:hypothetical protein